MPSIRSLVGLLALFPIVSPYSTLSDDTLKSLPGPGDDFNIHSGALLSPILRTRVSGTPGSTAVLNHFVDFFRTQLPNWTLEFQNSTSTTPTSHGAQIPFVNLIATRDPPGTQPGEIGHLSLVAHYDSKLTPPGFIGATDSAAPCAMLMHAARSLEQALQKKWEAMAAEGTLELEEQKGVQIILLDGEEAFLSWTDTDSLYGARALAESWEHTVHSAMSTYRTPLDSISLFLLLDLLGAKNPTVPSYFKTTHWAYKNMAALETRLRDLKQFKSSPNSLKNLEKHANKPRKEPLFLVDAEKAENRFLSWMVQDDHIPFMARGVEVLHIIPTPFPRVWHEMDDDGDHLDLDTVEDWAKLVTAFAGEWMELEGYFDTTKSKSREEGNAKNANDKKKRKIISKTEL
ncbi:glutaminyl-peptide cyclotransferase precursor [Lepidopterella palustris CBS 459.81]|uniref:Peptide hydrolase n=1 Tax=Lepidopterella palustris CBS 459.81 TaxID=1314670 RepID=A0A8E2E7Y9_9PEZI|nr:glutaminyl-peptide cyclotransferase precursor [Lepidopterella palustris CBS 459.81]